MATKPHDAMQSAYDEAESVRRKLVERGELLSAEAIAERLGVTRQILIKAVRSRRIFAVELNDFQYYPSFFADSAYSQPELEAVSKALGDRPGWEKLRFFTTPKLSLARKTPLAALKRGQLERVLIAAAGWSER